MTLTLIAELLAGETLISPGGPVDSVTACGLEPFLWERWALELQQARATEVDLIGIVEVAVPTR